MSKSILLLAFILFEAIAFGQSKNITGKIVDTQFMPVLKAKIFNGDTLLGETDMNGIFNIIITSNIRTLMIRDIGMERKSISLRNDCTDLEIILQPSGSYDFMSIRKINRLRRKEFDKLQGLHIKAFEKKVFKKNRPCYDEKFIPFGKR